MDQGIEAGDRVAIFSYNCPEWVMADFAIQAIGAVTVPLYSSLNAAQASQILEHAQAKFLFVQTPNHQKNLIEEKSDLHSLGFQSFETESWKAYCQQKPSCTSKDFFMRMREVKPDQLASIVYTSGTTGEPKGVCLSHHNIVSNVLTALDLIHIGEQDVSLSFLPLSHMFERMTGCYCVLSKGAKMAFCSNILEVAEDLKEVRPTLLMTVPRLLEKIHQKVCNQVLEKPKWVQNLFQYATGRPTSGLLRAVFEKMFFSKIREGLGGNLRLVVSGGAALNPDIERFFQHCGLTILQGYGLTETSPVVAVNPPDNIKIGTIGPAIEGVEVRIADDGELQVKGPNVMVGYFRNPEETKAVMTEDGYFKTGDIASIDEDGYIRITDRIKDLIVTSGGKKIAPQPIEQQLLKSSWIDQVCLVGEGQKTIGALIVPDYDKIKTLAASRGLEGENMARLLSHHDILAPFEEQIARVNENLSQYEKIKAFKLLEHEFTLDREEITPTLKLRRKNIYRNYASEISHMWDRD